MEIEELRHHLEVIGSNNPQESQESTAAIMAFGKENYIDLIQLLINIISEEQQATLKNASVFLFSCIKANPHLEMTEFISSFWTEFNPIFLKIIIDPKYDFLVKKALGNVVVEVVICALKISVESTIQENLLQVANEYEASIPIVMYVVSEILYGVAEDAGFSFENLITLISFEANPLLRFSLLFATAKHFPNENTLHDIFPTLLSEIPPENIRTAMKYMTSFAETNTAFFTPHIVELAEITVSLISDSNDASVTTMLFVQELFKNIPEVVTSYPDFIISLIDALFQTLSTVEESESSIDFENDQSPAGIARETFLEITSHSLHDQDDSTILEHISSTASELMEGEWRSQYAAIAAIASTGSQTLLTLCADEDSDTTMEALKEFAAPLVEILMSEDTHFLVRAASYCGISKLSGIFPAIFPKVLKDDVVPLFLNLIAAEPVDVLKQCAASSLRVFVQNMLSQSLEEIFDPMIESLMELIEQADEQLMPYLLECLGVTVMGIGERESPTLEGPLSILVDVFGATEDPRIHASVTATFACCVHHLKLSDEHLQLVHEFFRHAWDLRGDILNQDKINTAIKLLIGTLKSQVMIYADELVPALLEEFTQELEPTVVRHSEFDLDYSFMERVNTSDANTRIYVDRNSVISIISACHFLQDIVPYADEEHAELLAAIAEAASARLQTSLFVENIATKALSLIGEVMDNENITDEVGSFCTETISEFLPKISELIPSVDFITYLYNTLSMIVGKNNSKRWLDDEHTAAILAAVNEINEYLIQRQWNGFPITEESESDLRLIRYKECLNLIPNLYKSIIAIAPEPSIQLFEESLEARLLELIDEKIHMKWSFESWCAFACQANDESKLAMLGEILPKMNESNDIDCRISLFISLYPFFTHYKLDEEQFGVFYQLYFDLFHYDGDIQYDSNLADASLVSFAALCRMNEDIANLEDAFEMLIDQLPINEMTENEYFETVYGLLLDILEKVPVVVDSGNFSKVVTSVAFVLAFQQQFSKEAVTRAHAFIRRTLASQETVKWMEEVYPELNKAAQTVIRHIIKRKPIG